MINFQLLELQEKIKQQERELQMYRQIQKQRNIRVLNLIPTKVLDDKLRNPINIDFIHILNKEDIQIHVDTFNDTQVNDIIQLNSDFLNLFDVLIFNNGDSGGKYIKSDFHLYDLVENYAEKRGSVLMMNDFNTEKFKNQNNQPYNIFTSDIGYKGIHTCQPRFTKCRFDLQKCGDLINFPYLIGESFSIAETHETPMYDPKYKIIESYDDPQFHYYSENSEKRIADCSMGHDNRITNDEKKLLFNIIYHLSQLH